MLRGVGGEGAAFLCWMKVVRAAFLRGVGLGLLSSVGLVLLSSVGWGPSFPLLGDTFLW